MEGPNFSKRGYLSSCGMERSQRITLRTIQAREIPCKSAYWGKYFTEAHILISEGKDKVALDGQESLPDLEYEVHIGFQLKKMEFPQRTQ